MKAIRDIPSARTVFAIRQDTLFESIDFLTYSLDEPSKADCLFKYMYFYGVNDTEDDIGDEKNSSALRQVETQFDRSGITNHVSFTELRSFLSLESRSAANSFFIQLTGYMLENFWPLKGVKKIVANKEGHCSPRDLLPIFFDELIAGFAKENPIAYPAITNYDVFRFVLLTIAIENKQTGNPITSTRASLLAHMPEQSVRRVIDYLVEVGIVRPDNEKREGAVRFAHDILFEHIIESERFLIQDDIRIDDQLRLNIERLAERRIDDANLIPVTRFGNVWHDAFKLREPGAIAVVAFMIYGALIWTTAWIPDYEGFHIAAVCDFAARASAHFWWHWLGVHSDTCSAIKWYYPLVYAMDSAWVAFIYKLDRGYLQYALNDKPRRKFISKSMPVIGAALGIGTRFIPLLIIFPLISVGIILAILLISIRTPKWGFRTAANMIVALPLFLLLSFMVTDVEVFVRARNAMDLSPIVFTAKNMTLWLIAISFLVFLWHIRPEQQRDVSYAARLAALDVSRNNRHRVS